MDLGQCARRFIVLSEQFPDKANEVMRRVALAVDQTLVLSTPVDTGRARSNWIVSIGSDTSTLIDPYVPGSKLGIGEGENASAALAQGKSVLSNRRTGETIFITNNVPYIVRLNNGHSAQAPVNFIETAIMDGVDAIRGASLVDL